MKKAADRPTSAVNGRHESPATSTNNTQNSGTPSLNGQDPLRSTSSSPLFGTEPLPEDDHASCPYCQQDFRKPRVLDCLHSMCEDCIIAQLDGHLQAKSAAIEEKKRATAAMLDCELETPKVKERPTPPGVIRCPICSQESHVGNDVRYVHAMLLDFVRLAEMKEVEVEKMVAHHRKPCTACKSEQEAIAFCDQCSSDLCENCTTAHTVMNLFQGHTVTTFADLRQPGAHPELRQVMCSTHNQHMRYLCAACETAACKQCLEVDHLNHKIIDINELVINAIREDVTSTVDRVEKKYNNSVADMNSLPDKSQQLNEQYEIAKYRVDKHYEELRNSIEEAYQKSVNDLEEARIRQESNIDEMYRKSQVNEARVHDAINFTRRLLTKGNGLELVVSRKKVIQQFGNLSHAIPSHGHQVELEFYTPSKKQIDHFVHQLTGTVIGRVIQPTVKDVGNATAASTDRSERGGSQPGGGRSSSAANPSQQDEWGRPVYSQNPQLGAIGGERKKNTQNGTNGTRGDSNAFGGWPPSSHPPESTTPPPVTGPQTMITGAPTQTAAPIVSQQQLSNLPNAAAMAAAAAGMRPDLVALAANHMDLAALTNGSTNGSQTPLPESIFPAMWNARQGLPAVATPTTTGLSTNASAAYMQQKLAAAQLQALASHRLNPQIMSMNNLRTNQTIQEFLAMNAMGNLSLNPQLTSAAAAALAATAAANSAVTTTASDVGQSQNSANAQRVSDLKVHSVFGTSQQGSTIRELHCPSGFCLSDTDDILIADTNNHRVVVCGPPHPWKIGRPGTDDGQLCFPRKVIALRGEAVRYVVLDKGGDGKTRAQIFEARGEFVKRLNMMALVPRGGIEVSAAAATPNGQLLLVDTAGFVYSIDVDAPRVTFWFDASTQLGEASDVAMFDNLIYITDFKHHCVQVYTSEGKFIRKMGEPSQTPYPIGIDVSKAGEVLVADTHGNHLHVVVFSPEGQHIHSFTHNEFRLSRCVGLRIAKSGHIVTLCKHNHTLFVFKPLILPNGLPVPTPVPHATSLISKFQ
ncbi:B box-type domain-containing protein [Caenorhabditis elegans]|uniref:B box-type domain-containing protein n=1 Tax=Caenorhabditis elegans TaxID=6239 RepID=Q19818_CAEEL|nr:RING-type E3 ubiquitin transferase [Caenorhabditis elegans]CCD65755.1 RING-type E3 ubiquitin transferase [Caenorhabditis elegans]|eukprot:NP_498026.1 NHL (ring finger b-box coiled coil) domain containing [Caenorhabditis elegans]